MKTFTTAILILLLAFTAGAQESTTTTTATTDTAAAATATSSTSVHQSSDATRQEFDQLLREHPPQVARVLKLDPTLFRNETWLATYPAIRDFVARHPEVGHTPAYYLQHIWIPGDEKPESESMRMWNNMIEGISIFMVVFTITAVLAWLIKTLVDHRRWSRVSRVQAEVHNKLLDRFASNEELLQYIQTPAGRRFLETAPLSLDAAPRPVAAPANRILWSLQIGVIIAMFGLGMFFVSNSVDRVIAPPLAAMGTLALAVGIGFVVSSFLSFVVSRRLGLWEQQRDQAPAE